PPTHAPQAVAALPGPEHLLNASPYAPDRGVVRLQPRERVRSAPGARVHEARRPTPSADDPLRPGARKGAVAIHLARLGRQHRLQLGRVMDVGGCNLDPADQPGFLVGRNVGLVAVHGLAAAMAGPARLAIMP